MSVLDVLTTTHWFALGPAPITSYRVGLGRAVGRVEAAAADPGDADVMYVGGDNGGVWKTATWRNTPELNTPPTWLALSDDQRSLDFSGYHPLVVHPANHNLILAVVSGTGAGMLKSTNGALSWQLFGNDVFEGATLGSVAVDPTNTQTIYVSVWNGGPGGGVYRSLDGGLNWENKTAFHAGDASDVIVAKWHPHVLFAGLTAGAAGKTGTAGVYATTDGGDHWQVSAFQFPFLLRDTIRLESAAKTGVLYCALFENTLEGDTIVGRYMTANAGQLWQPLSPTPGDPELRSWHVVLAVDSRNADHVLVNDAYALYESTDGGQSWLRIDESIGDDWVNASFDADDQVVFTADRNLYRYDPRSKGWVSQEGNLQLTEFWNIALDPQNPDAIYGIAQDQVTGLKFDAYNPWTYMDGAGGEVGKILVDPTDSDRLYVYNPTDPANMVRRSLDGGQSWSTILGELIATLVGEKPPDFKYYYWLGRAVQRSFVLDPSQPTRMLVATGYILETTDASGATPSWSVFSDVLSPSGTESDTYITALAIAPSASETVYAATADGHVWVTDDNGGSWGERDDGLFGASAGRIVDLDIDPTVPTRAFAVTTGQGGIWLLSQQGSKLVWQNVSGDFPTNLGATSLFVDWRYVVPSLYVGTDRGVYHSVDVGKHWKRFGLDMPNTLVTDLKAILPLNVLAAATFGRGAWEILITPSRIRGRIFHDIAGEGIPHKGASGIRGVRVFLDAGDGVSPVESGFSATTDESGHYVFDLVPPGTYSLYQMPPPGYVQTTPERRVAVAGSDLRGQDFGNRRRLGSRRAREPYVYVDDLNALPGRRKGQPISAEEEAERR